METYEDRAGYQARNCRSVHACSPQKLDPPYSACNSVCLSYVPVFRSLDPPPKIPQRWHREKDNIKPPKQNRLSQDLKTLEPAFRVPSSAYHYGIGISTCELAGKERSWAV